MGLFGAFVRTAVNVVALPVTLPVAIAKDVMEVMTGDEPENTRETIEALKRDADEER